MKSSILLAALATLSVSASAETPLWLRNAAIAPDGKTVAFTYKGNIFTVPTSGGDARQLTSGGSYNTQPVWSPDGSVIVFSSDREGTLDLYSVASMGGTPKRLTTFTGSEKPLGFASDSVVVFSANILPDRFSAQAPFGNQTYSVSLAGGRPQSFSPIEMCALSIDPSGRVLYHDKKGFENMWRKHERSSGTSDIWLRDGDKYEKLTSFNGHDFNPVWGTDDTFYYLTEESDGTLNVHSRSLDGKSTRQLTHFKNHPVRSLSATADGRTLAFSWDGELYTLMPGSQPAKINVNILADDYTSPQSKSTRGYGATSMALSPDGELLAFVLRGDVYITSVKYKTTRRITDTPAQERTVDFAPDGRSIVYDSERDGLWQLFTAEIKDPAEKSLLYATEIVEKPLYKGEKSAFQPDYSPDGKKVAFLEDRTTLKTIDVKSKEVKNVLDGKYNYSYSDGDIGFEWSPDSRWLLIDYIGIGGWQNTDIALVSAGADSTVVNLTESGYANSAPQWAMDGKAVAYTTGKYGYKSQGSWGNDLDVIMMFLDGDAADRFRMTEEELKLAEKAEEEAKEKAGSDDKNNKKKDKKKNGKKAKKGDTADDSEVKPLKFDLDNRKYRRARLTASSSNLGGYYVSPKGDKLYYTASSPDGRSLYERDLRKGDTRTLAKGLAAWNLLPDKDGKNVFVFAGGSIMKVDLESGTQTPVEYEADYTYRPAQERSYIFDHAWQQVADKFHDVKMHGTDWPLYRTEYAKFLPHITNNYDFAELLSELLGELNASHTGGYHYASSSAPATATLGAFFDPAYTGDGLKVAEVIKRGPLASASAAIRPGDIITAIADSTIKAGTDYYPLLEGRAGKKVKLTVSNADGKDRIIYVRPISLGSERELLYNRWVERNERAVDSLSGGRIGYVHVKGMDGESFSEVYDRLLGKYRNCDAVVVDTRYNGGGWLHNDLAILLNGKEYVRYTPRGRYVASDPFSQWCKPSVMLVNESNYSDAHGAPYVYQTLGIGDVVGAPIPGTMTAVWWETQIDPSIVFGIPQVTSLDRNGQPLENKQLNPDVLVYNNPATLLNGTDEQLATAVAHLQAKLKKKD